jgi:hypothetical protein
MCGGECRPGRRSRQGIGMNRALSTLLSICVFAGCIFSQAQMSSGDLKGTATDTTGGVLPEATVTLTNIGTGVERSVITDGNGEFKFFVVPPGSYEVRVQREGLATYTRRPIQVTLGATVSIDAELQPAALQQEVLVQEDQPLVEVERTQQSDTITTERIENLPINQRNFLDFALLTPGVTDARGLVNFSLPQTPSSGLSFLGQGGRYNSVTIDGVDNNDNAIASVRSTMSQEAVLEFQINRTNFSAEFGRASGGLINIVSKSGENEYRGSVFAFLRDQALDARNPFAFGMNGASIDPPFSRLQTGFAVGGPVKKNRSFFFLSYEGLRQRESRFVTFLENRSFFQPTVSQSALIAGLSASPSPTLRGLAATLTPALTTSTQTFPSTVQLLESNSGAFPYRNNDNTASLRLDHALTSSNQMFGRLTFTDIDTIGGTIGGLRAPSRGANYQIQDYAAVFGNAEYFGPRMVNEFRSQFAGRQFNSYPADRFGPEVSINGIAFLGRDFFLPSTRNEKRLQLLDHVTFSTGKHYVKFGGDFHYLPISTTTEVFLGGRFIFGEAVPLTSVIDKLAGAGTSANVAAGLTATGRSDLIPNLSVPISSLQAFNFGLPIVYQQGFGNPTADLVNKVVAGYLQDNFRATSNLTLNFGLRYDFEFQPSPVHRDSNNFGPRIGFAYSPNPRTVVRGGYGVYYSPLFEAAAFVSRVLDGTQISQIFLPLSGVPQLNINTTSADVWALAKARNVPGNRVLTAADIATLGLVPGVTPPVVLDTDPNIVNPYSQQFSFGIDREVAGINLSANYLGNRGVKLIRSRNVNLRQIGTNAYGPVFGPINPAFLQESNVESSGSSIYHGLAMTATKRYTSHYQFQVSYTFSKAIDDTTDFITDLQPANQLNLRNERGLSAVDQRHRLVMSGILQLPWESGFGIGRVLADMTVAPIISYSSGHPFNLLLGFDANNDTQANTDRPLYAGRNTGRGPSFMSFDLRVAKQFSFRREANYRMEAIFEAFNLFNRVNFSGVNNIVGNTVLPSYSVEGSRNVGPADPLGFTSAFDPRQIQLGVKFKL